MQRHFIKELEKLKMTVLKMATLARRALQNATRAYLNRDEALARQVVEGDREINDLEMEIDELSLTMLALEQPMAKDLRFILGCTKISNELERIADQGVNIAERTVFLCQNPPLEPIPAMERLIEVVDEMLEKAITAFAEQNTEKAFDISKMDDIADQYTLEVLQSLIAYMAQSTPLTEKRLLNTRRSILIIIISRCLERTGDMATNIAEQVEFIVKGNKIKYQ
jgi:phosphate transport system protein